MTEHQDTNDQRIPNEIREKHGIAVYLVRDVYKTEVDGTPIPESELNKWFVSTLSDSPYACKVAEIPLAASEAEAWNLAAIHLWDGGVTLPSTGL